MSVFGPRVAAPLTIRTFRAPEGSAAPAPAPATAARPAPPGPAMLVPPPTLLDRLLAAAMDAELAQLALAGARDRCARGPTPENQRAVLLEAANALEKEIAFDELWETASSSWLKATA